MKSRKITKVITIFVNLLPIRSRPPTDFETHQTEKNTWYIIQIQHVCTAQFDVSFQFSYISYISYRAVSSFEGVFTISLAFLEKLPNHIFCYHRPRIIHQFITIFIYYHLDFCHYHEPDFITILVTLEYHLATLT